MTDPCAATLAGLSGLAAPVATTLRANGKAVEIRPGPGEAVLAHETDTKLARHRLGHPESAGQILDGVFYWRKADGVHIVLVELKGNHITDACKQLAVGLRLVKAQLPANCGPVHWHGVIVPNSGSQQQRAAALCQFARTHGFSPKVNVVAAGSKCVNIGSLVG